MYNALLQQLRDSPVLHNAQITELIIYGPNTFRVKMRALVDPVLTFQVWVNHNPQHTRYAYQLFRYNQTLLRWDNAPHYPTLTNFPHHTHDSSDQIHPSPLLGDPLRDMPIVLAELQRYLAIP